VRQAARPAAEEPDARDTEVLVTGKAQVDVCGWGGGGGARRCKQLEMTQGCLSLGLCAPCLDMAPWLARVLHAEALAL